MTYHVVSEQTVVDLGVAETWAAGDAHGLTLAQIREVAESEHTDREQAVVAARALGGAYVVDGDGDATWVPGDLCEQPYCEERATVGGFCAEHQREAFPDEEVR